MVEVTFVLINLFANKRINYMKVNNHKDHTYLNIFCEIGGVLSVKQAFI